MNDLVPQIQQSCDPSWASIKDAAAQVLRQAQQFLQPGEIAQRACNKGMIDPTPEGTDATIETCLTADIVQGGSQFARSAEGTFGLQAWLDQEGDVLEDGHMQARIMGKALNLGAHYGTGSHTGHTISGDMKTPEDDQQCYHPGSYEASRSSWQGRASASAHRQEVRPPTPMPRFSSNSVQWTPNGGRASGSGHATEPGARSSQRVAMQYRVPCQVGNMWTGRPPSCADSRQPFLNKSPCMMHFPIGLNFGSRARKCHSVPRGTTLPSRTC
ncbi:unnamed protein product [Ostreobium quekettii]|uniref:HTH HARE-type domain-containing protein n=1 Tax=Ostreobium quekettii TaxID=121088 RepID=A0A8S1J8R8_9CHLO|nr:unnamed protein product [Ostreobium quekettii]